jgi:hypothetical protein
MIFIVFSTMNLTLPEHEPVGYSESVLRLIELSGEGTSKRFALRFSDERLSIFGVESEVRRLISVTPIWFTDEHDVDE